MSKEIIPPFGDYREPIPEEIIKLINSKAGDLKRQMPQGWGFAILMFTYGEGGKMVWLSSADRQDMLRALQEFMQSQAS